MQYRYDAYRLGIRQDHFRASPAWTACGFAVRTLCDRMLLLSSGSPVRARPGYQMELQEAKEIGVRLISLHGLDSWSFRFNKNKRRLGVCKQDEQLIELSEFYVQRNTQEHVLDTILHEIAHAMVGTQHGHNDTWKAMCLRIGASPASCSSTAVMPDGYWQAKCPGCVSVFTRHRRPRRLRGRYCVACGPIHGQLVFSDIRQVQKPRRIAIVEKQLETAGHIEAPKQLVLNLLFG